ncbi:hypothetical protein HPP92_022794 [Vanilla planifolia]|uniref:PRELI/MSF1 domain-containing protein n=1 Tax=Vanilla planifolia TaxID=51239 RepID=A0A835PU77_VANPL|nr:hypothetical protein HPP92_022794 [Vanilla planifolia]
MVRAYKQEHVYCHPWDRVATASWRKFTDPDTPAVLSHVLDVHTLSRRLDASSGHLHTVRSITVRSPTLPFFLRRLVGGEAVVCHCIETSVVDPRSRSMDIVAVNASLRGLIEVEERSSYRPHPDNPEGWTIFRQETSIRCKPFRALAAVAEGLNNAALNGSNRIASRGASSLSGSVGTSRLSPPQTPQLPPFDALKMA